MTSRSLRLRLLSGAALATFAALALAWLGMNWLFERHIERREAHELERHANMLVAGLILTRSGAPASSSLPADPRFSEPSSGLYWQLTTPHGAAHSLSLWDQSLSLPGDADSTRWQMRTARGPFEQRVLVVERRVRPDSGGMTVLVQVAADDTALRDANAEFGRELGASLLLLWLVLMAAAWAQVHLGLRPLSRVRAEMERLRRSPAARLHERYPREIAPLTDAINALADAREADLMRARKRAADLAHSLKTPLSALAAQSRHARTAGAEDAAEGLDKAIAAVNAALEAELARARAAAARNAAVATSAAPLDVAEGVIGVIERTRHGETIVFDVDMDESLRVPVAPGDLAEILGALLENAARFARRQVQVRGWREDASTVCLAIGDDGPGIGDDRTEAALMRGGRLDEAGPGHGLGLAIVQDLMTATEGRLTLGRSALGGLEVTLGWNLRRQACPPFRN